MRRVHVVSFAVLLSMAASAFAQSPNPKQQRRRRPQWQATLTLPKDLWHDVTAETIGETAEWTNVGPGEYSIRLTVTDSQGFTDTDDMDNRTRLLQRCLSCFHRW